MTEGRPGGRSVPQAISGLSRLTAEGSIPYRPAQLLAGAERATLAAFLYLDRLVD
jgi:hypothetical protein